METPVESFGFSKILKYSRSFLARVCIERGNSALIFSILLFGKDSS
jgi:hypothetical protein